MPDNLEQQTDSLMRMVAGCEGWVNKIDVRAINRKRLLATDQYNDLLTAAGCRVDIWRTTYYHVMPSPQAIC